MAEAGVFQDQISCSVCLDTLKDPVTIPCGHSYCLDCIKSCWDQDDSISICSCPQCRETFTPRPVLRRNIMLVELVERLTKTGLNTPPPPPVHSPAGPGDVLCDFCTEEKTRAVKSCLVCLASYCQSHLQPHYEVAPLKKHKLVDATGRLDDVLCPNHQKLLEVYCHTDQKCICLLCTMDDHKSHNTVSAAAERAEKQKQLGKTRGQYQQRVEQREKELKTLRQAVESLKSSAQTAVQDSERIFTELIRSIDRRRCEVTQMIRAQETAAVSQAERLIERLEKEIAELRTRDADLKQLSLTEDHVHFLQKCQSLCAPPGAADSPNITVSPLFSLEAVGKAVTELKERLEDVCQGELVKISQTVKRDSSLQDPEPRTRAEFLQYTCDVTLDPNTMHRRLIQQGRTVTVSRNTQSYPDHPERFDRLCQVLCREGLSGTRCYWEAGWSGRGAAIGVTYRGISREGQGADCRLGFNDKSWSLECSGYSCSLRHNKEKTAISTGAAHRIGVFVDHGAGTVSFYSVSDTMTLLHRVQTTFTDKLYPGFGLYWGNGDSVTLCQLE
ncbi:TRI16 protein, partial [Amia calva]|nr:TRI16 protein [Amia calva]